MRASRLSCLDLYLSHTPVAFQAGNDVDPQDQAGNIIYGKAAALIKAWQAMESLVDKGKCKAIGLSDVVLEKLVPVYEAAQIKPAVVRVEARPPLSPNG